MNVVFSCCANWETFVAHTKSETFFVSQTKNLCPQQMLCARANGETYVSATMCPQQCVLVCQGLKAEIDEQTGQLTEQLTGQLNEQLSGQLNTHVKENQICPKRILPDSEALLTTF